MKTILNFIWIITLLMAGACNKSTPVELTKRSSVTLRASTQPKQGNSGRITSANSGDIEISSAKVRIADIRIEENSGNDNDQVGDNNNADNQADGNEAGSDTEGIESDIILPGPYSIELTDNQAVISNVMVLPGTYKKVNFKFVNDAEDAIHINGNYIHSGTTTPFNLSSSFNQPVQLLLANGGITVAANSSKDIAIVFDIKNWFATLDLSTANVTNGKIMINKTNNTSILAAFEAVLLQHIDAED